MVGTRGSFSRQSGRYKARVFVRAEHVSATLHRLMHSTRPKGSEFAYRERNEFTTLRLRHKSFSCPVEERECKFRLPLPAPLRSR